MKKLVTTILAFVYLSTSMGATIHLHYCMGKLFSWSLFDKETRVCDQCGMVKSSKNDHQTSFKEGCCKDKHTHIQLDKDQKATENDYSFPAFSVATLPVAMTQLPDHFVAAYIIGYPTANAPPEPDKVPVFIRNCTFRI